MCRGEIIAIEVEQLGTDSSLAITTFSFPIHAICVTYNLLYFLLLFSIISASNLNIKKTISITGSKYRRCKQYRQHSNKLSGIENRQEEKKNAEYFSLSLPLCLSNICQWEQLRAELRNGEQFSFSLSLRNFIQHGYVKKLAQRQDKKEVGERKKERRKERKYFCLLACMPLCPCSNFLRHEHLSTQTHRTRYIYRSRNVRTRVRLGWGKLEGEEERKRTIRAQGSFSFSYLSASS